MVLPVLSFETLVDQNMQKLAVTGVNSFIMMHSTVKALVSYLMVVDILRQHQGPVVQNFMS